MERVKILDWGKAEAKSRGKKGERGEMWKMEQRDEDMGKDEKKNMGKEGERGGGRWEVGGRGGRLSICL